MIFHQVEGWVFVGFPDEHLRSMLRPGSVRLWDDARTIGKQTGQPVFFLQTREKGAAWVGSGVVTGVEERWKAFGVYVETQTVLSRMLVALPEGAGSHPSTSDPANDAGPAQGMAAWENRTLAARLGLTGFRPRTPYLEAERDLRLTASDWNLLCQLQPLLENVRPR